MNPLALFGAGFSIASAGLEAKSQIEEAEGKATQLYGRALEQRGQAQGFEWSALKADRAAEYGRLQATQTGTQLSRELNATLGNIDAVRAAARTDPSSPTGAAVRGAEEEIGIEQKTIKTGSLLAQANQNEADAAYYRNAATTALLGAQMTEDAAESVKKSGKSRATATILGSIGKGLSGISI